MYKTYFILIVLSIINFKCRKSDSIVSPEGSQNLLTNASFESNGNPSFDRWSINLREDSIPRYLKFSQDVPPGGGRWSAAIENPDSFIIVITSSPIIPKGSHKYRLSLWAKSNNPNVVAILNYQCTKDITYGSSIRITDTVWRPYTVTYTTFDTLTTSDSTKVIADSSRFIYIALWTVFSKERTKTYFDLVTLEQID